MELSDFSNKAEEPADIKVFQAEKPKRIAFNDKTVSNLAAKTAMASGNGDPVETYLQVSSELKEGNTETPKRVMETAKEIEEQEKYDFVIETMGDLSIDPHEREKIAQGFANSKDNPVDINLDTIIGMEAIKSDSSPFESSEEETTRVNMAGKLKAARDYRQFVQTKINEDAMKNNPEALSKLGDFVEVMTPYVEQGLFANIVSKLKSEDPEVAAEAFVLLGSAKVQLRDAFASMPPEERRNAIPALIDVITSSDTVVFNESNDMIRQEFLRSIIDEGYYGAGDEIVDNVVSVLDAIGLGFTVKGISKGAKAVKATLRGKRQAKALAKTIDEFDAADRIATAHDVVDPLKADVKTNIPAPDVSDLKPLSDKQVGNIIESGSESALEHMRKSTTRSDVSPTSVSQVYKDTNPQKARELHTAVAVDKTGQVANATYNTNRVEAVVNDLAPEINVTSGSIRSKLAEPDALIAMQDLVVSKTKRVDDIKAYAQSEKGAIHYLESEKKRARSRILNDMQNVNGMTARKEMFTWGARADGIDVKGIYGPQDGGFVNAQDARELAQLHMRNYGILEQDVSILSRTGETYQKVPSNQIDNLPEGDYLVQVDYSYKFRPEDVEFEQLPVSWNGLDRFKSFRSGELGAGSIQTHVLDANSMLSPVITGSASVAVDKSAKITQMLGEVTKQLEDGFKSLSKPRKEFMTDLFKEANAKEFDIDQTLATARGLSKEEYDLSQIWRKVWNTIYHLENADLRKTMVSKGFKVFTDPKSNTTLYVKPLANPKSGARVYDPIQDKIVTLDKKQVEAMYDTGGEIASTRSEIHVNGETVSKIMTNNNSRGYIRAFSENDNVLNYRKGYYQVHYKDPHFIEKSVRQPNGEFKTTAIATAKTKSEAELITRRLKSKAKKGEVYSNRLDKMQDTLHGDSAFETIVASGRSAQRVRGQRLQDSSGASSIESAHLMDPSEALELSIASISRRVELRDWLDATKARFMKQYGNVLPKDDRGVPQYPISNKLISVNNSKGSNKTAPNLRKEEADAATTWEYIRAMEDGYVNHIDEGIRGAATTIADFVSGRNNAILDATETFMRNRAKGSFTQMGKKKAFQLYLALNPLRQIIVQSHQMVQIAGIEPKYLFTRLLHEATALTTMVNYFEAGGKSNKLTDARFNRALKQLDMTPAEAVDMYSDWEKSGLQYAVDTHNLTRSNWEYATRGDFIASAGKLVDKGIDPIQKMGFDAGERANIMSAWLTFRHRAVSQGNKMNPAVAEQVSADARNFTYNMNKAGDMPYNSNAFALALQFMQVPHKATTQVLFNRALTRREKTQMAVWNTAMYGAPALWLVDNYFGDILPDDDNARKVVVNGLETVLLNKMMSVATDDDVDIDWGNLAPADAHGMLDSVHVLFTSPMEGFFNAPAIQMVSEGGRVRNLFNSASKFFGVARDYEENPTSFGQVATDFAELSSGLSNAFKAAYALAASEKLNTYGDTAFAASKTEAILQAFGFRTLEEAKNFESSVSLTELKKGREKDFSEWFKQYKRHMAAEGKPLKYYEEIQNVFNEVYRVFPNDRETSRLLDRELRRLYKEADYTFIKRYMEIVDWTDLGKWRDQVKNNESLSDEQKAELLKRSEVIEEQREELDGRL